MQWLIICNGWGTPLFRKMCLTTHTPDDVLTLLIYIYILYIYKYIYINIYQYYITNNIPDTAHFPEIYARPWSQNRLPNRVSMDENKLRSTFESCRQFFSDSMGWKSGHTSTEVLPLRRRKQPQNGDISCLSPILCYFLRAGDQGRTTEQS